MNGWVEGLAYLTSLPKNVFIEGTGEIALK